MGFVSLTSEYNALKIGLYFAYTLVLDRGFLLLFLLYSLIFLSLVFLTLRYSLSFH